MASQRWLDRSRASWLHEEVGRRMQDRLQWMRQAPAAWLDWWPLNGGLQTHARVRERYPQSRAYLHERHAQRHAQALRALRGSWWQRVRGRDGLQPETAPTGGVDMLWANMALHSVADPMALLQQWQQALAVDGFVMFSCLGPDTAREIQTLYAQRGWPPPCHAFTDMHDWGDMLVQAGFAQPVMDMERLTLTYASPDALLQHLRVMGRNLHRDRFAACRGRRWRAQLLDGLSALTRTDAAGRCVLTVEVIYGHAIKVPVRPRVAETSTVSLADMRTMLKPESR
jgi:malonyl-CoA O-methyltransferase